MDKLLCSVIMLPTNEVPSYPWLSKLQHDKFDRKKGWITMMIHEDHNLELQHLYLVSDREIKEGDYVVDQWYKENVMLVSKIEHTYGLDPEEHRGAKEHHTFTDKRTNYIHHIFQHRKIEATTDKSLGLPLIPQVFIQEYVKQQGEIDKVYIQFYHRVGQELVSSPYNEVIILPIKDSFTLDDMQKAYSAGMNDESNTLLLPKGEFNKWFDENY